QRTGTVILKRTYTINPVAETLSPLEKSLPVFMQDQADNLLRNSDFDSPLIDDQDKPIDWHPEKSSISLAPTKGVETNGVVTNALQIRGDAQARVVQTLTFDKPLGGRQFTFSFFVSADTDTSITNARLEAEGSEPICVISTNITTSMSPHHITGAWPAGLQATEMRVVLRMADNAAQTVYYDNVQVEERGYQTIWNSVATLRYEHDLAAFKPEGDVIVLGLANQNGVTKLNVNGSTWLERPVGYTNGNPGDKAIFGWEPRIGGYRQGQAGTFP
ncbi:MAG: hypothetical protein GY869_26700, partial [Planctomycetes bacterium]|nr:hypothetical protein [Planctomycetota bacterium]